MARTKTTVRPPWDLIEEACTHAVVNSEKPTRAYIKQFLSRNYEYTHEPAIDRGLDWGVIDGIYEQIGDAFYVSSFEKLSKLIMSVK